MSAYGHPGMFGLVPPPPLGLRPPMPNEIIPSGPQVTVFVGNITERAQDAMIRHLLTTCGPVHSWKRVQGATGKLQAFGFCEYGNPDAGLRAIRILHDFLIGDKKLVVKVDAKTKELLEDYKTKKLAGISEPITDKNKDILFVDERVKKDDAVARERIRSILNDHSTEMEAFVPSKEDNRPKEKPIIQTGPKESLDDVEMEDGKRDIIHREIDKFRETMKIREAEKEEEKKKKEEETKKSNTPSGRMSSRSRERSSSRRVSSPPARRSRSRTRDRRTSRRPPTRSRSRSYSPSRRRRRPYSRSRSRSRSRRASPSRKSQAELLKDREIEEEAKERKKAERKAREKEANYQERLRKWESRESKMSKDFEREKIRENKRLEDIDKEAKKLKEFLEDYDDEKDDCKYYRGRELEIRLSKRDRESAKDAEDRSKEKIEIEELKNQILDEGYRGSDTQDELQRRMNERNHYVHSNGRIQPPIVHIDDDPVIIPMIGGEDDLHEDSIAVEEIPIEDNTPPRTATFQTIIQDDIVEEEPPPPPPPAPVSGDTSLGPMNPIQLSAPAFTPVPLPVKPNLLVNNSKNKLEAFSNDDDDSSSTKKRRTLPPLSDSGSKKDTNGSGGPSAPKSSSGSSDDKRKHIKSLIEKIPTDKTALFAYKVDWDMVDSQLMEKRIQPWVNKKIAEYIGEPEPTLTEFICSRVLAGTSPKSVLEDVQMVLDEEAEVFVVKMWRLLIYEIENKKSKAAG